MKTILPLSVLLLFCLVSNAQDYNWVKKLPERPTANTAPVFLTDDDGNYVRFDQGGFYGREKLYFEVFEIGRAHV